MNVSTRGMHRPRPPAARTTAAIVATAALALLATACGSSPSSTGSDGSSHAGRSAKSSDAGGSANAQLVAFSRCVRSHGVPNFPDPQAGASNAKFPSASQLRVSSSQLSTAENACQRLLPVGIDDQFSPAEVPLLLRGMLPFARCMRSHGVPNFPDPANSDGHVEFVISVSRDGFDPHSPQILAKARECQHVLPAGTGLPSVTVSP